MSRIRNLSVLSVLGVASLTVLALTAPTATAATASIHQDSISGPLFSGGVVLTNVGDISVKTSLSNATCTSAVQEGSVDSDGANLAIASATFSGCTSDLGSVDVTASQLPWTGGAIVHDPVDGGRDGTLTFSNYTVGANAEGVHCVYSGTLVGDVFNPDNANRPDTSVAQSQVKIVDGKVKKLSGSFLCPGTATVNDLYQLVGAKGEKLWTSN